ncbi:unnamed protein product [Oncorhynchus mykiss]|uniref:Uncharacterized protein n=1 Tax=Oncorhynchus mykiss TaxID=8022 RepID=A0A060X2J1_ONCMY|nr:unnamed protein product [Oncorhynchus mykiss]
MSCQSVCADLPPPPAPPPAADDPLQLLADVLGCSRTPSADNSPALQKREDYSSPHKRGPAMWGSQDEGVIPYCPSSFLPRGQMSDYGSLGGGASSRASTGQRGPGAVRRRDERDKRPSGPRHTWLFAALISLRIWYGLSNMFNTNNIHSKSRLQCFHLFYVARGRLWTCQTNVLTMA